MATGRSSAFGREAARAGRLGAAGRAAGRAGGAQAGWPAPGAVIAGIALALGLLSGAAALLGLAQRLGLLTLMPPSVYTIGAYGAAAAGGWTAGRLAGRRGAPVGFMVGLVLGAVALWAASAGRAAGPMPDGAAGLDWAGAAWRVLLAAAVAALGGALGVAP